MGTSSLLGYHSIAASMFRSHWDKSNAVTPGPAAFAAAALPAPVTAPAPAPPVPPPSARGDMLGAKEDAIATSGTPSRYTCGGPPLMHRGERQRNCALEPPPRLAVCSTIPGTRLTSRLARPRLSF